MRHFVWCENGELGLPNPYATYCKPHELTDKEVAEAPLAFWRKAKEELREFQDEVMVLGKKLDSAEMEINDLKSQLEEKCSQPTK